MNYIFNILVVEDEGPKRLHLVEALKAQDPELTIHEAGSVNEALAKLDNIKIDLIMLDMSLPTFTVTDVESGGRPQTFGGLEILRTLVLDDIHTPVIVITGFEAFKRNDSTIELEKIIPEWKHEFSENLIGVIQFNSVVDGWRKELQSMLNEFFLGSS